MATHRLQITKDDADGQFYWHTIVPRGGRIVGDGGQGFNTLALCTASIGRNLRGTVRMVMDQQTGVGRLLPPSVRVPYDLLDGDVLKRAAGHVTVRL